MKWEDPASLYTGGRGRGSVWIKEAAELRSHPKKWGILAEYPLAETMKARQLVNQIRKGRLNVFRSAGDWEATSRKTGDVVRVYVRYIGEETRAR